jgi:aminoglycoside/choline kinase family phosphotransferase
MAGAHQLLPGSVRIASADASFRRYLRVDTATGQTRIIMDAPPAHENCAPFVHVAALMQQAGLRAPRVLAWEPALGFMLLTDLGAHTMMDALDPARPAQAQPLFAAALDALLRWQQASRPRELPPYDAALLRRELALFPEWYLGRYRGLTLDAAQQQTLAAAFEQIVRRNLTGPCVYVHRDYMPRNLMLPESNGGPLGVLDFQDAVYGPVTYDIASLLRDAFISWDADFVLDLTIRYWERARRAGLLDFENWASDFGSFWCAVEWMALQRHLKVAGIFARLTLRDGKPKYLADAPRFIGYIRATARAWPELTPLLRLIDAAEEANPPKLEK